jgi:hypothetical protein
MIFLNLIRREKFVRHEQLRPGKFRVFWKHLRGVKNKPGTIFQTLIEPDPILTKPFRIKSISLIQNSQVQATNGKIHLTVKIVEINFFAREMNKA